MQRENLSQDMFAPPESPPVRWRIAPHLVDYPQAVETMEREAAAIAAGTADELVWLVEHPPLYTAGTSADAADLVMPDRFPVFATGRGGEYTYHGPGQRVVYVMLDLKRRRAGRAGVRRRAGKRCHLDAWFDERQRRTPRGSRRRLGSPSGKACHFRTGLWRKTRSRRSAFACAAG